MGKLGYSFLKKFLTLALLWLATGLKIRQKAVPMKKIHRHE
jgi:hypothetical protein